MADEKRCTAKAKRTGRRCERAAVSGCRVCRVHGGGAVQVVAAGQRRLADAKAVALAGRIGIAPGDYDADPRRVLTQALITAQHYAAVIGASPDASWPAKLAALDQVARIALGMARLEMGVSDAAREAADEAARGAAGRMRTAVLAAAERAVYEAARGEPERSRPALAALRDGLARLAGEARRGA
jgi:hypothetical protein